MNIYQRIVLIVGAVILLIVVFKTFEGGAIYYAFSIMAIAKGLGVAVATILVFFALKDIGKKQ